LLLIIIIFDVKQTESFKFQVFF